METARRRLGDLGEDQACRYLERLGHVVQERNWRKSHLEIDIISQDVNGVHFVEVKSRVAPVTAAPEENVTPLKQRKIASAALRCLHNSKDPLLSSDSEVHFDIVAVTFEGGEEKIEWFPDAFIPMYL